jgi:hypothetical protein
MESSAGIANPALFPFQGKAVEAGLPIPSGVYSTANGYLEVRQSVRFDTRITWGSEEVLIRELRWHSGQA